MNIKKYLVYDNVNDEIKQLSENLFIALVENEFEGSFYVGYPIFERDNTKHIVPIMFTSKNGILVIYENEAETDDIDGFIMKIMSEAKELIKLYKMYNDEIIIFVDKKNILDAANILKSKKRLIEENLLEEIDSYLQNSYSMNKKDNRKITNNNTLGDKVREINTRIATLDETQFEAIFKKTDKHMRIRGLAGSGKTILLVRKMAYIHFNHPELKMAYIFYSVSLKEYITTLFTKFYRDLAPNKEPNFDNVLILHCWGSSKNHGFYSYVAESQNIIPKTYSQMAGNEDRLDAASKEVINLSSVPRLQLFDYVFIDEAQDFRINFFKMAVKSLTSNGKLFYAYDELQSLSYSNNSIPSITEIFSTKTEEVCDKIDLEKSYRCPNDLLVSAHALGLGLYYKDKNGKPKLLNMIDDLSVWQGVGYHVLSGELDYGKHVELGRVEDQRTKTILSDIDVVDVRVEESFEKQIESASIEIIRLLDEEDILPEDILIIDLDSINLTINALSFRNKFIEIQNEHSTIKTDINLVNKSSGEKFSVEKQLTYTTVYRAKGNEANIVFILNAGHKDNLYASYYRNSLFTAMTRAKVRTYVYGDANENISKELLQVKQNNYRLNFTYPTKIEMKTINKLSKKETVNAEKYINTMDQIKKILQDKDIGEEAKQDIIKMLGLSGDNDFEG